MKTVKISFLTILVAMEKPDQLSRRLEEVLLNGTWIANTNFMDQISNTDWKTSVQKVQSLNTIAALTFHVNYYIAGFVYAFRNGSLEIRDKYSFDFQPPQSQEDWDLLRTKFREDAEQLVDQIKQMGEQDLDDHFFKKEYGSYRRNIEGLIEHSYYHLGQVSLIRKLISEK